LIATLVIGEVLNFTWFMPNFIADAPIQPEKASSRASRGGYRLLLFAEIPAEVNKRQ
jgi:hypothetical protein